MLNAQDNLTGIYKAQWGADGGGTLKVLQLQNNKIQFYLECKRGAPTYNSGMAEGIISLKSNVAVYIYPASVDEQCELKFIFTNTNVVVEQNGQPVDCGFGYGVFCNATYKRISNKKPTFD